MESCQYKIYPTTLQSLIVSCGNVKTLGPCNVKYIVFVMSKGALRITIHKITYGCQMYY